MSAPNPSVPLPPSFNPLPTDPPQDPRTQTERDQWIKLDGNRYLDMCNQSLPSGNFNYVKTALQVNHEGIATFINSRMAAAGGNAPTLSNEEAFLMLNMQHKINAMLMTVVNRAAQVESDGRTLVTRVQKVEEASNTNEQIT